MAKKKVTTARPPEEFLVDARKALRIMRMIPKSKRSKRREGESLDAYRDRYAGLVRVAAQSMRRKYKLTSVWSNRDNSGFRYDIRELKTKYEEGFVQVRPKGHW